jgi:hypothetical protein
VASCPGQHAAVVASDSTGTYDGYFCVLHCSHGLIKMRATSCGNEKLGPPGFEPGTKGL